MYPTKGSLRREVLVRFEVASGVKPQCAWYSRLTDTWMVGAVNGAVWPQIEKAWGHDYAGNWTGSPPSLLQAVDVRLLDEAGLALQVESSGFLKVSRSDIPQILKIIWYKQAISSDTPILDSTGAILVIRSAETGEVVYETDNIPLPFTIPELEPGSYSIYIQYVDIVEGLKMPPDEERLEQYDYETQDGRISHYNPDKNFGEVPAATDHPLRLERLERIKNNTKHDVPEYAIYLTSEEPRSGEGSMILLQVGDGDWEVGEDVFISPARPLFKLDFDLPTETSPSTPFAKTFDPMASQISWITETPSGKILLGGARMNKDGTHPALWEWDEVTQTGTLLGVTENACNPVCEQMLSTGGVTGIVELLNSETILMTLCSVHKLSLTSPSPENRLPRYPLRLNGEPGGRGLISLGNRVIHTTEAFGRQPDPQTESFYNVVVDIQGNVLVYSPGTISQVDSCLWLHRGKAYGIRADKAPTIDDAEIFITYYDGSWKKGVRGYKVNWIYLNRGCSINGRYVVLGNVARSETAAVVLGFEDREQVLEFDYRVRAMFPTQGKQVGYRQIATPARKVVDGEIEEAWSVICFDGRKDDEEWPEVVDPPDDLTTYYRTVSILDNQPKPVYEIHVLDCSHDARLTQLNEENHNSLVRARVDSDAPVNDLDSYIYPVRLNQSTILPIEANSRVEVISYWEDEVADEELPIIAKRA